jgi:putative oxygen-independent coproporphyrinogen III oxidase
MSGAQVPLGIYVHVPFCAARCGYCDFNTYVPKSAGQQSEFVDAALAELRYARAKLGDRMVSTVFFGGGTPTLLGADELLRLFAGIRECFRLDPGAEVTTETNPESVDLRALFALRAGGFTRVSIGMQSAVPHVLRALDRVHTPGRAVTAALDARAAGFEHVSVDLIYGTAGETDADWDLTLDAALYAEPDHVSAYALTVEPGTALAAAVGNGAVPAPDDSVQARRFAHADDRLQAAGFEWYELSSWASNSGAHCRHNIGYWRSYDWWGIGPGAHSHVNGVRWWNVLRPGTYSERLGAGGSPAAGSEVLTDEQRALEAVLLGLREREGLGLGLLTASGKQALERELALGRVTVTAGRAQLTRKGRLFADAVARELSA